MVTLTKLGISSVAKLQAIIMAVIGLIFGIVVFGISMVPTEPEVSIPTAGMYPIPTTQSTSVMGGGFTGELGFLAIIIFPIAYGIIGFIGGAIGAWLYNLLAGWFGGIEMEFEQ